METINLIFSSDNNYAQFLGVTLCSIFENKKSSNPIIVYVLDGGIKYDNKEKLAILEKEYKFSINYIKVDSVFFKDFYISHHITQATYYRIIIPDLLPNLEKALYLDCDIIVLGDIKELYEKEITNHAFAAVEEKVTDRQKELGMPLGSKYFNAGVMLINFNKWKELDITKKTINFIQNNPGKLKYWDQDSLNAIAYDKWASLDVAYNYMTSLQTEPHIEDYENNIFIIHYSSPLKPWNLLCKNFYKKYYFYYLKKTPWRKIRYVDKTLKNIVKKILKHIVPGSLILFFKKIFYKL